jgi:hypothetical protein
MLPTTLLDLTSLRISILRGSHVLRPRLSARYIQQAALATPSIPYNYPPPSFSEGRLVTSGKPIWDISAELERRVKSLEKAAVAEVD